VVHNFSIPQFVKFQCVLNQYKKILPTLKYNMFSSIPPKPRKRTRK
jgi:hypothetical protein